MPLHPVAASAIAAYLERDGRSANKGPLFRPVSNNMRDTGRSITPDGVFKVLAKYATKVGIDITGFGSHALRATAATNALENGADIAKVQTWLSHANIATTRRYDRRQERAEDSPTLKVAY